MGAVAANSRYLMALLPLMLGLIGACSKKVPVSDIPLETLTLEFGIPIQAPSLGVEVTFVGVIDDVRCRPGDMACDWPGMAVINLRIVDSKADTSLVAVAVGGVHPSDDSRYLWPAYTPGLRIIMLELTPLSAAPGIVNASYRARIEIVESNGPSTDPTNVIISDLSPEAIDVHDFKADSVWVTKERLHLSVVYGGGCRDHKFSLFMSPGSFVDGQPRRANLYLRHYAANDLCRALVTKELIFNLGGISQFYRFTYATFDPIGLNLIWPDDSGSLDTLKTVYTPELNGP